MRRIALGGLKILGGSVGATAVIFATHHQQSPSICKGRHDRVREGFFGAVGDTPLIELKTLSKLTGCRILAKAEHLSPSGSSRSVKDRAAVYLIRDLERKGVLKPGGTIVEGTGGNTDIGLALAAASHGYQCIFAMPASIAREKVELMKLFGAEVHLQPSVPFSDPGHYFQVAARLRKEIPGAVFPNQFENLANYIAHLEGTGPEIYRQAVRQVDGFVCSAGTGGTIAGVSRYLKMMSSSVQCYIIDPPGSSLYNYITKGALEPSAGSSVTEGIGIGRLTENFKQAQVDGAFLGSDQEIIDMAYYLLEHEGMFVGPSAALNVCGAVKLARLLGPGKIIVTIICDGGERYRSTFFDEKYQRARRLHPRRGSDAYPFKFDDVLEKGAPRCQ